MSICRSTSICRDRIPRSASWHGTEGQSTRGLHPCGPIQGSSRRSVTATLRFASHRGRTLVRKKSTHENNLCKPSPDNLRATTRNQLSVVQNSHEEQSDPPRIDHLHHRSSTSRYQTTYENCELKFFASSANPEGLAVRIESVRRSEESRKRRGTTAS